MSPLIGRYWSRWRNQRETGLLTQVGTHLHPTSTSKMEQRASKTYNTKDSPVVTDLSTDLALTSLIPGERTGSHVSWWAWSYVLVDLDAWGYVQASRWDEVVV